MKTLVRFRMNVIIFYNSLFTLYWMVQDGIGWYRMVQDGIEWSMMVQDGIGWHRMILDGVG